MKKAAINSSPSRVVYDLPESGDEGGAMSDGDVAEITPIIRKPKTKRLINDDDEDENEEEQQKHQQQYEQMIQLSPERVLSQSSRSPHFSPPVASPNNESPFFSQSPESPQQTNVKRSRLRKANQLQLDDDDDDADMEVTMHESKESEVIDVDDDSNTDDKESAAQPHVPARDLKQLTKSVHQAAYGSSVASLAGGGKNARGSHLVAASLKKAPMTVSLTTDLVSDPHSAAKRSGRISAPASGEQKQQPSIDQLKKTLEKRNAAIAAKSKSKKKKKSSSSEEEDSDEYDDEDSDEDEEEEEEEDDDESAASEEVNDNARRRTSRSTANKRKYVDDEEEEEEEEEEAAAEEEEDAVQYDSDEKPIRNKRNSKAQPKPAKATAKSTPAPAAAPPASSLSKFFSKNASSYGEQQAKLKAADSKKPTESKKATAASQKKGRGVKRGFEEAEAISIAEVDSLASGEENHYVDDSAPARRASSRPTRAAATKSASASAEETQTGRRSGRARTQISYKEKDETEDLEVDDDEEEEKSAPSKRGKKKAESDEDEADQSFFDDNDELDSEAQKQFNARFATERHTNQSRARATKKVTTTKSKAAAKKKKRRGSDDDDDDSNDSDSDGDREEERKFERENGLIYSDAEESSGSDGSEPEDNPIEKIIARRQIRLPLDPSDPNSPRIGRTEYFCKYKDLSYHQCDWIDRKTIENWHFGKNRISAWTKAAQKAGSDMMEYDGSRKSDKKLFKHIEQLETKGYERDQAEGVNQLIENETSRENKKMHPKLKIIDNVWAPVVHMDDSEEGDSISMLFDPAYLEVERVIAERPWQESHDGIQRSRIPLKEYLVKWCNLPYSAATWEDDIYVGEFIMQEHIDRFHASLKFPTTDELKRNRDYLSGLRPIPDTYVQGKLMPTFKGGRELRDYQIEGVNWLSVQFFRKHNCILADEMGLGKTIQSVAFLRNLKSKGLRGPFLVLAPLSCTPHWQREFESWCDDMFCVRYSDTAQSRDLIAQYEMQWKDAMGCATKAEMDTINSSSVRNQMRANVVITSYETFKNDIDFFQRFDWQALIMDEAHQVRNDQSKLYQCLTQCNFLHKVFLTGTPIQNRLGELFTLLHLVDEVAFPDREVFEAKYADLQKTGVAQDVTDLQKSIRSYMFRRMKGDVEKKLPPREETLIEVELTPMQKQYYRAVFESNLDFLRGNTTKKTKANLTNVSMQLRLTCNHPYLLPDVEEKEEREHKLETYDDQMKHVVNLSGKMVLLEKLLTKLKAQGSRVLIFSQFVKVLDIIEDYLNWKEHRFERLDGSTPARNRQVSIDRFSQPNSDRFVFLLSTRAGGMGINLTAADTVIIFDSDWNPQGDVQAIARSHRIGQQKRVQVYRLITRGTYESELFDSANLKLGLDRAVLHTMDKDQQATTFDAKEVESLLRKGAAWMLNKDNLKDDDTKAASFCAADIETILEKNSRAINTEAEEAANAKSVGATGARSGLASFTHATFSVEGAGEQTVALDHPDFWNLIAKSEQLNDKKKQKPKALGKRAHKQLYDLSDPRGRGAIDSDGSDDFDDMDDDDEAGGFGRRGRPSSGGQINMDEVDVSDEDADTTEKYYSGTWSKRQSIRFLTALQVYGYHRIPDMLPFFPGKTVDQMKHLAISYIVKLTKFKKHPQQPTVLIGAIRQDLLALLKKQITEQHQRASVAASDAVAASPSKPSSSLAQSLSRLEVRTWNDLLDMVEIDMSIVSIKFEASAFMTQSKRVLDELTRLVILHCQLANKATDASKESKTDVKSEDTSNADVSIVASSAAAAPDTTLHVKLPIVVPSLKPSIKFEDSSSKDVPADWWIPAVHDPALLLGVYALGYQHTLLKVNSAWEQIRSVNGLPFKDMEFAAKKLPGRRCRPSAAEGDNNMEIDETSKDSAAAPTAAADAPSTPTPMDVDGADKPGSTEVELPSWPPNQKLKTRFTRLLDQIEKDQREFLPHTRDYRASANRVQSQLNLQSREASGKAVAATAEEIQSLASKPPQWNRSQIKKVIKVMTHFGKPSEKSFQLPATFFGTKKSSAANDESVKQEESKENAMDVSGDEDKVSAASSSGSYTYDDSYAHFLNLCEFRNAMAPQHLKSLVEQIYSIAKKNSAAPPKKKEKEKEKDKDEEKKESDKEASEEKGESVDALISANLSGRLAKTFCERIPVLSQLRDQMPKFGMELKSVLRDVIGKSPFPSYRSEDDEALLIGCLKHGLGNWSQMREDASLSIFKGLVGTKAAGKKDAAAKTETEAKTEQDKDASMIADDLASDEEGAKETNAASAKGEEKLQFQYQDGKVWDRLKVLVNHLRIKAAKANQQFSTHSASVGTLTPTKAPNPNSSPMKQVTLGSTFGVKAGVVEGNTKVSPQKKPQRELFQSSSISKKMDEQQKKRKDEAKSISSLDKKTSSSKDAKPLSTVLASSSTVKPSPTKSKKMLTTNMIDEDVEDIDDFMTPEPPKKSPSPTKKQRTQSPQRIQAPTSSASNASPSPPPKIAAPTPSKIVAPILPSIAALDAKESDTIDLLDSATPPPNKKQKFGDENAKPVVNKTAAVSATKTSSSKPASASSAKKVVGKVATGSSSIASFFSVKPSVTIKSPAPLAPKKTEGDVIDLE